MGNVGGDPSRMTGGAAALHKAAAAVSSAHTAIGSDGARAAGAAGDPTLAAALSRFAAAWSTMLVDTGTQLRAASQLAANAAQDLATAGGH